MIHLSRCDFVSAIHIGWHNLCRSVELALPLAAMGLAGWGINGRREKNQLPPRWVALAPGSPGGSVM